MKKMLIGCLFLTPLFALGQQKRFELAEKLYERGAYADAAEVYEDVLARGMDSVIVSEHISESYDEAGNPEKAVAWYAFRYSGVKLDQDGCIRYTLLLCTMERYEEAAQIVSYAETHFGENDKTRQLKKELERFRSGKLENPDFQLRKQNGNSDDSEMSVIHLNESKVLFSSNRDQRVAVRRYHALNNEPMYDLFVADVDSAGFSRVRRLNENTKYHDGSACLDSVNQLLYFTRNNYINGEPQRDEKGNMLLKILCGHMVEGKLEDVIELPFNSDRYSCAHPSVSADGKTLVFASNMPGTIGGMDLFCVQKDTAGKFGIPVNMGANLNTPLDELFPFFHQPANCLFFASNGHYGFGGLDVFVAKMNKSFQVRDVVNLGKPVNSPNDDFAFISDFEQRTGYLTSNRSGGVGNDDFYAFDQSKPFKSAPLVTGDASDFITAAELDSVWIVLVDANGNRKDSVRTGQDGRFELELDDIHSDFNLAASRNDYISTSKKVAFLENQETYNESVQLIPDLDYYITGTIRDKETREVLKDVKIGIMDLSDNRLIARLISDSTGGFRTEILEEKQYGDQLSVALLLEKEGYLSVTYTVSRQLEFEEEINVNALIDPVMSPISIGTDLSDLVDLRPIYFDYRKWNIRKDAALELDKIVKVMKDNPGMKIELGSHTDSRGDNAANLRLSNERAKSSVKYIISQGIDPSRITAKGYGETQLIITDAQLARLKTNEQRELAHQKNRRTEFIVVKM